MNWNNIIGLILPTWARKGIKLRRLLQVLTSCSVSDAQNAEVYKDELIDEQKNIGQKDVVEGLLHTRYDSNIYITGTELGSIMYFGDVDNTEYRRICADTSDAAHRVVIPSVNESNVGTDFVVHVPETISAKAVEKYVSKFVFAGVGFKVRQDING